jgi:hypothetical protein
MHLCAAAAMHFVSALTTPQTGDRHCRLPVMQIVVAHLYQLRDYEAEFGIDQEDLLSCVEWRSGDQGTATALWLLQSQIGVVRRDDYTEGNTVLSYAENLPDDAYARVGRFGPVS